MKIDKDGQIAIPEKLRQVFGLEPGVEVQVEVSKDGILIKPMPSHRARLVDWLKETHGDEFAALTTDQIMSLLK